ncbi:hypothetical protein NVP1152O_050 [Vibrio phage 1.152.O._10N.222.46.E1]|uniref:Uncharacterized protein n=5 Tax=Nahantvirus 49C7 TaxID=2846601 RepID=A0A2I7RBD3_9CAUD|nr:hypothetical protein HYP57_gp049 [Vibrio phage 1.026.O._10N.222.49.C7]AUR82532.1 hypothetical protein NVP1025O_049 [Vibrio phage 1.025.O._10N.222.46.B6]AUR90782.1 hypothetical protein NVP1150O_049 [Vibrio phage 1.150.O._10N.222.46.A6]AUR90955.1 hypothetical protein NVP1152O_050 [Vibrio phage 1.152.O._10N.222.46.E1]AUS02423.1 hypothetical protein NVP2130O_049 [Vibrio phage 2.130.O._10N.222.46.C2]AUR82640.1 hypothetical protein NVP1026O_049 [Vibrio phage 1.026.O._10N.222.49.C7]
MSSADRMCAPYGADQDFYGNIPFGDTIRRVDSELKRPLHRPINTSFTGLSRIAKDIGEEQFKEMAPHMYALYKEMKLISDYQKMADILEDN